MLRRMYDHIGLFPVAVVVAISIFVAKEVLEAIRRSSVNRRKLRAIKDLLAAECERNNWAIDWLNRMSVSIQHACNEGYPVRVETTATGVQRLVQDRPGGASSSPIPKSTVTYLDKYLFEVAALNAKLFREMLDAMEAANEITHLREGLIHYVVDDDRWLEGWSDHAAREVPPILESFSKLYRRCTGKPLTQKRVR